MALSKDKKIQVIDETKELLKSSRMTVVVAYQGTPVKALQQLRRNGREDGTTIRVIKNRLIKQALTKVDALKDVPADGLEGMLMYVFNSEDEVAPAKVIAEFAKKQKTLEFVGAISAEGKFLSAQEVTSLAELPSKPELIASVLSTLGSPVDGVMNGLSGNLHSLLDGISAQATS